MSIPTLSEAFKRVGLKGLDPYLTRIGQLAEFEISPACERFVNASVSAMGPLQMTHEDAVHAVYALMELSYQIGRDDGASGTGVPACVPSVPNPETRTPEPPK